MEPMRLPRRERNKLRNREEILEAALIEFSEKGFHATSVQDIAARAEFALGTVYSLFGSKEELYLELISSYVEKAGIHFHEVLEEGTDEYNTLMGYVVAKGELLRENPRMARIAVREATGPSTSFKSGLQPIIREQYEFFLHRIAAIFERGIRRGAFHDFGSYYLAVLLDGITSAFFYLWLEDPEEYPYEKSVDFIEKLFRNIILTKDYQEKLKEM